MKSLPANPNLEHLRKQAKELLRLYRNNEPQALARVREHLPAARNALPSNLRLHDAQSCIAREYGFASWAELKAYTEAANARRRSRAHIELLLQAGADPHARTAEGMSAYRTALQFGLADVAQLLREAGAGEPLSIQDEFLAACARADEQAARRILDPHPDLLRELSESQLQLLPNLASTGCDAAVKVMVRLGWPMAVTGGDWAASALNHAVFRGNSDLTRFLLEHGASWREVHGFGDDVTGTLSWASLNEPVGEGDWVGCAEALLAHGMPSADRPQPRAGAGPAEPGWVRIDGRPKRYAEDVAEVLLGAARPEAPPGAPGA